jgi:hypothetical protein
MIFPATVFHVLYWVVNAPYADGGTTDETEAKHGKSPALEYG